MEVQAIKNSLRTLIEALSKKNQTHEQNEQNVRVRGYQKKFIGNGTILYRLGYFYILSQCLITYNNTQATARVPLNIAFYYFEKSFVSFIDTLVLTCTRSWRRLFRLLLARMFSIVFITCYLRLISLHSVLRAKATLVAHSTFNEFR